jgi:protein-tyrosine-phosphatase/DNA-binding transcriptional ArsR family regulator
MFFRVAGHPVRWRLLSELTRSDRQVGELCKLLGQPQNLVSYHLGRLRAAQLVSARRSSADARDAYYRINLARCGQLLAAAGGQLHPGLQLAPPPLEPELAGGRPARVLFLCTGNSARSQMAEALLEHRSNGTVAAASAGSHPKPLHANAVRVMRKRGIDINSNRTKHLEEFVAQRFDLVITLCDRVREVCPEFPSPAQRVHWSMADPALDGATNRASYRAFERTADELESRIRFLLYNLPVTARRSTHAQR